MPTLIDVALKAHSEDESALTTWTRLEALPVSPDLAPALEAQIADPLWLLARQWQFAEFQGEDAGSPLEVRLSGHRGQVSRFLAGTVDANAAARAIDYGHLKAPLEVFVEREPARRSNPRLAAEAGQQFRRLLLEANLASQFYAPFAAAYPLTITADQSAPDRKGAEWAALLQHRSLDGRALAAAFRPLASPTPGAPLRGLPIPVRGDRVQIAKVREISGKWLQWYDSSVTEGEGNPAWDPHRQEYSFALSAQLDTTTVVLVSDEYTDGELDWYSFRAQVGSLGQPATPVPSEHVTFRPRLATHVRYPGMPADRFWEFEDATINFGSLDAGPTDLGRLLLAEFALVYGNDWFIIPVEMKVGSLFKVSELTVVDTFGVTTQVLPSRQVTGGAWCMFDLSTSGWAFMNDVFFLPPVLPRKQQGDPIEEVGLFRDEMANLAWAVERKVQGVSGEPYSRYDEGGVRAVARQIDYTDVDAEIVYRLATPVAPNWIPLVPVPVPNRMPEMRLERRIIEHTLDDGSTFKAHPKGLLLRSDLSVDVDDEPALWIEEEEIPRAGAVVTRSFQYTRWFDGTSHLWAGRAKRPGKGEGSSGLRYDTLVPPVS